MDEKKEESTESSPNFNGFHRALQATDIEEDKMPLECSEPNTYSGPQHMDSGVLNSWFTSVSHSQNRLAESTEIRGSVFRVSSGDSGLHSSGIGSIDSNGTHRRLQISHPMQTHPNNWPDFESGIFHSDSSENTTLAYSEENVSQIEQGLSGMSLKPDVLGDLLSRNSETARIPPLDIPCNSGCSIDDSGIVDEPIVAAANAVYKQDVDGDNQLIMSIIHERPDYTFYFISLAPEYSYLNVKNNLLQTALHLAVITMQNEIVRRLMVGGASVDVLDCRGNTPLHIATMEGLTDIVRTLVDPVRYEELSQNQYDIPYQKIPQNLEVKNYDGQTCLHLTARKWNLDVIKILLSKGANVNSQDGKSGRTILHYAAEAGKLDIIQFLVTVPSLNLDAETYGGATAIALAMGRNLDNVVSLLVSHGGSLDLYNSDQEEMEMDGIDIHAPFRRR